SVNCRVGVVSSVSPPDGTPTAGPGSSSRTSADCTFAVGATVSISTTRLPVGPAFPAASWALALIVVANPSAGTVEKLVLQLPAPSAVTTSWLEPQVTVTVELASAVPTTATPAPASLALTRSEERRAGKEGR